MADVAAVQHNGFSVASTFSGCGGSSLGYRMAGFRVLWASEFVPAAVDTYRANAAPGTVLDTRDIREVTATQLCEAAGVAPGELDLFDGSPPCASFSTAGKRHEDWGTVKSYSDTRQRTDDLFFEYVRLVEGVRPRVFVAENVSGLVKGSAKGYFKLILKALRDTGYDVSARVLDAAWLGVPQLRQRLIFVGVRRDLQMPPAFPRPLPYQYTVRDALPWINAQGNNGGFGEGRMRAALYPSPTIGASVFTGNGRFPPSAVVARVVNDTGSYFGMGDVTDGPCPTVTVHSHQYRVDELAGELLHDPETGHPLTIRSVHDCRARNGDVYRYQGHVRRLTLNECRALCGFPADFVLTGTYAQRWERLGRAVPPVMMSHIAATVRDEILSPLRAKGVI